MQQTREPSHVAVPLLLTQCFLFLVPGLCVCVVCVYVCVCGVCVVCVCVCVCGGGDFGYVCAYMCMYMCICAWGCVGVGA